MSLVLRVGQGVERVEDARGDGERLLRSLSPRTRAELAEWHALAAADPGGVGEVLRRRAEELAAQVSAETGAVVRVEADGAHEPEPTPWGTGLTLALGAAVLVLVAVAALYTSLAPISVGLGVVVSTVVVLGLLPGVLALRTRPVWRWVVLGGAVGGTLAWVSSVVDALG